LKTQALIALMNVTPINDLFLINLIQWLLCFVPYQTLIALIGMNPINGRDHLPMIDPMTTEFFPLRSLIALMGATSING
jgi:hypothetical protein